MPGIPEVRTQAMRAWLPPPQLPLSKWIEANLRLPASVGALPGPLRLYQYQKGIADAISDPAVEKVTLVKAAQVGFSTLVTAAIGHYVCNDPAQILCILPVESDCRDYTITDIDPIFQATPCLRAALTVDQGEENRNTMLSRRFSGGSLKIVAAHSPRNLRRHVARVLLIAEADAMETSAEGDPIDLALRRTVTFRDRKIVLGSTPKFAETSHVLRSYAESDQSVYEIACPECAGWVEISWGDIKWDANQPETAKFCCPLCGCFVEEHHKPWMIAGGRWRPTRPEITTHRGFRLNVLVSPLPQATWWKLAAQFLAAKMQSDRGDPSLLQSFTNTCLAQGWNGVDNLDEDNLADRVEEIGIDRIPPDVLLLTAGVDLAKDRAEATVVGHDRAGGLYVLAHFEIYASPDDPALWVELDHLLKTTWRHPRGGKIGIAAAGIDSGNWTQNTYDYVGPLDPKRRIMAVNGVAGAQPVIHRSQHKYGMSVRNRGGCWLWLVGVDGVKNIVFARLQRGDKVRFSDSLQAAYFEELAAEKVMIRYQRGKIVRRYEKVSDRARNEALDCLVYAFAALRSIDAINWDRRQEELSQQVPIGRAGRPSIASMLAR